MIYMVGGYHVKVREWITGEERQSTVENVHVEWPTVVQVEENVITPPALGVSVVFFIFSVSEVGAALMGDNAGTSRVSRPKHGV